MGKSEIRAYSPVASSAGLRLAHHAAPARSRRHQPGIQVVQYQIGRIEAPEEFAPDGKGGHAEDSALCGFHGALLQRLLDLGPGDGLVGVGNGEPLRERLPLLVAGEVAPFDPYGVEDRAYERRFRTLGDGEAQRAQRVERMRRRHAKGDAVPRRVPVAPAVGVHALGRNFRRPLVLPVAEQAGEENRAVGDLQVRRQPVELDELQIGEGREKIEVPVGGPHRPVPHVPTSGSPADCARFRLSARGRVGAKPMEAAEGR